MKHLIPNALAAGLVAGIVLYIASPTERPESPGQHQAFTGTCQTHGVPETRLWTLESTEEGENGSVIQTWVWVPAGGPVCKTVRVIGGADGYRRFVAGAEG